MLTVSAEKCTKPHTHRFRTNGRQHNTICWVMHKRIQLVIWVLRVGRYVGLDLVGTLSNIYPSLKKENKTIADVLFPCLIWRGRRRQSVPRAITRLLPRRELGPADSTSNRKSENSCQYQGPFVDRFPFSMEDLFFIYIHRAFLRCVARETCLNISKRYRPRQR